MRNTPALVLMAALSTVGHAQQPTSVEHRKPIVLEVKRMQSELTVGLIPNPRGRDVFNGLIELLRSRGPDYPVVVLFDSSAQFSDLVQEGLAAKVGFTFDPSW